MARRLTPEEKDRVVRSLREACLKLVRRHGVQQTIEGKLLTEYERPPFTIWLTPWGDVEWLDVWHTGERNAKVMNLWWSGNTIKVNSFRRGAWEVELLELARQDG